MNNIYYYLLLGICLYFIFSFIFSYTTEKHENFDPSLVPVSSIINLNRYAQSLQNGTVSPNLKNLQVGYNNSTAPADLIVTGSLSQIGTNKSIQVGTLNFSNNTISNNTPSGDLLLNSDNNNVRIFNNNLNISGQLNISGSLNFGLNSPGVSKAVLSNNSSISIPADGAATYNWSSPSASQTSANWVKVLNSTKTNYGPAFTTDNIRTNNAVIDGDLNYKTVNITPTINGNVDVINKLILKNKTFTPLIDSNYDYSYVISNPYTRGTDLYNLLKSLDGQITNLTAAQNRNIALAQQWNTRCNVGITVTPLTL